MLEAGSYRTLYDGNCRIWYGQGCAQYWMASKNKRTCPHIHDYWYVSVFPNRNISSALSSTIFMNATSSNHSFLTQRTQLSICTAALSTTQDRTMSASDVN